MLLSPAPAQPFAAYTGQNRRGDSRVLSNGLSQRRDPLVFGKFQSTSCEAWQPDFCYPPPNQEFLTETVQ